MGDPAGGGRPRPWRQRLARLLARDATDALSGAGGGDAAGVYPRHRKGANLRFAGKDVFLKSHGFDHLYGAEELKTTVADPTYRNDWGFYDDTVLDETWKKFEELSQSGKRFSLFALTVDTHHPDGFISRMTRSSGII